MITFLQQSLTHEDTFAEETDPARATHYREDNGPIRVLDPDDFEPLAENDEVVPLPVMNFGKQNRLVENAHGNFVENIADNDEVVPLPVMNFDKKPKANYSGQGDADNGNENVLSLPKMF
jgi:hypothetical protein